MKVCFRTGDGLFYCCGTLDDANNLEYIQHPEAVFRWISDSWNEDNFVLNLSGVEVNHSCCMKRKLMLAMTRKILQWLQDNETQLQNIDYVNDGKLI